MVDQVSEGIFAFSDIHDNHCQLLEPEELRNNIIEMFKSLIIKYNN